MNNARDVEKLKLFVANIEGWEQTAKKAYAAGSVDSSDLLDTIDHALPSNIETRLEGKTALHYAAEAGCYYLVGHLIESKNADINAKKSNRKDSLHPGDTFNIALDEGFTTLDLAHQALEKNAMFGETDPGLTDRLQRTRDYLANKDAETTLDLNWKAAHERKKPDSKGKQKQSSSWQAPDGEAWKKEILKNRISKHLDPDPNDLNTKELDDWLGKDGPSRN